MTYVFFHIILVLAFIISVLGLAYNMMQLNAVVGSLYLLIKENNRQDADKLIHLYNKQLCCIILELVVLVICLFLIFSH